MGAVRQGHVQDPEQDERRLHAVPSRTLAGQPPTPTVRAALTVAQVMRLQATAGNAAVASILRTLRNDEDPRGLEGDTETEGGSATATADPGHAGNGIAHDAEERSRAGDAIRGNGAQAEAGSVDATDRPGGVGAANASRSPAIDRGVTDAGGAMPADLPAGGVPMPTAGEGSPVVGGGASAGGALGSGSMPGAGRVGASSAVPPPGGAAAASGAGVPSAPSGQGSGGGAAPALAAPASAGEASTAGAAPSAALAIPESASAAGGPTTLAEVGSGPDAAAADGGDGEMAEFTALIVEVETRRTALLASGQQREQEILAGAAAEKQRFRDGVEAKATQVEADHDVAIAAIRERSTSDQQTITGALATEIARTDQTAETELARLAGVMDAKKAALRDKSVERAGQSEAAGEQEATRAVSGGVERTARARTAAALKTAQYQSGENGDEIVTAIRSESEKLTASLAKTSADVARTVRGKAADLASHFREDAAQAGGQFDKLHTDGRGKIVEARDSTKQALRQLDADARAKIAQEAEGLIVPLVAQKAVKAAEMRGQAPMLDGTIDATSQAAVAKNAERTAALAAELVAFGQQGRDGGWYPPFVAEARSELFEALGQEEAKLAEVATLTVANLTDMTTIGVNEVDNQSLSIADALLAAAGEFASKSGEVVTNVQGELRSTADTGVEGMKTIPSGIDTEMQKAVEQTDQKWGERLREGSAELRADVDKSLESADSALTSFVRDIDARAARAQSSGWLDSVLDVVGGIFEGVFEGVWDLLTSLWDAISSVVFWIVVGFVVLVLAVIVAVMVVFFGWELLAAIGAVLALAGKVLLVIGVIVGVATAAYYVYLMVTRPNLSWRERGRLLGRAFLELVLAFAGTGILKRLKVFNDIPKLARFVKAVGNVRRAVKLVLLLPDIDKLFILLDRVSDVEKLVVLVDRVRDFDRLMALLDKVSDAGKLIELLDKVKDSAQLLRLLSNSKIPDVAALERILGHVKVTGLDADKLIEMLDKAGDVDKLVELLDTVGDAERILRLLRKPNMSAETVLELFGLSGKDGARLEKLLDAAGGDAQKLKDMLTAVGSDPLLLEKLADLSNDGTQLDRLLKLAPGRATDLEEMLRLLGGRASGAGGKLEMLFDRAAAKDPTKVLDLLRHPSMAKLVEGVPRFAKAGGRVKKPPFGVPAAPADLRGYTSANMKHFVERHIAEFFDFGDIKNSNSMWPDGTAPADLTTRLEEALEVLHGPPGKPIPSTPFPPFFKPQPTRTLPGGVQVQVGFNHGPGIGQFVPISGPGVVDFVKVELEALATFFGF
jgi:hypothetical protein